jgi:hypothetical protein
MSSLPPTRILNGPVFELLDLMDDADAGQPYKAPLIGPVQPHGKLWKETDNSRTFSKPGSRKSPGQGMVKISSTIWAYE